MKATTKQVVFGSAIALLLAIGAGVIWAVAGFWAVATGESFWESDAWSRSLVVRSDGTPLIESRSKAHYQNVTWTTLDGTAVPSENLDSMPQAAGASPQPPHMRLASFPRLSWGPRIAGTTDMRRPCALWYLVHDGYPEGRGYFVGYDSESKQCLGYIGVGGARDDRPPAEDQFPIAGGTMRYGSVFETYIGRTLYGLVTESEDASKDVPPWVRHFISDGKVWRFDPRKKSVTLFLDSKDAVALGVVQKTLPPDLKPQAGFVPPPAMLAVRTPDRILLVDRATAKAQQFRLPAVLREAAFRLYLVRDDELLFITERRSEGNHDADVYWTSPDGTVRRYEQCRLAEGDWTDTNVAMATAFSVGVPAPIVATLSSVFGSVTTNLDSGKASTFGEAVALALSEVWPPLAVLALVSAALAWQCYRRQVRYALPGTAWWVAFVFLGGLPGYLGYRFHRSWVALRQCPHCRQSVPRDREACARCGEAFPLPAKLGTEVFAA